MTISRSPLKDSDFVNYAKFLVATGVAQLDKATGFYVFPEELNATTAFKFTNCGKVGRTGPTQSDVNNSYLGTNLENLVSVVSQGVQEWTIPETGEYYISAMGDLGGYGNGGLAAFGVTYPGYGAFVLGKFSLNQGQRLNIVVGQQGEDGPNSEGAGGGGGSFVWLDGNSTPLIVAGGGGGAGEKTVTKLLMVLRIQMEHQVLVEILAEQMEVMV